MNALYAILFSNKTLKIGKTSNLATRVGQHKGAAKSMGQEITHLWVTPYHVTDIDTAERDLISHASEKLKKITSEFFSCDSEFKAFEIVAMSKEKLINCDSVFTKKGKLMIEIDQDNRFKNSGNRVASLKSHSEIIYALIRKFGSAGVSEGVLRNRKRNLSSESITESLIDLQESDLISKITKQNNQNKSIINWYFCK